jgi:hypothetical protein
MSLTQFPAPVAGTQTLAQTLILGNTTNGKNTIISDGDLITGSGGQIQQDFGNDLFWALTTDGGGFLTPYINVTLASIELASITGGGLLLNNGAALLAHNTEIDLTTPVVKISSLAGFGAGIVAVDNAGIISWIATPGGVGDMTIAVYDPAGVSEQLVGLTAIQAISNKTGLISQWTNDSGYLTSLAGAVTSVGGTANRITSTGGATPVIDIDAAYDALWQPIDADLTSIAALGFVSTSFLKKTAANTWALDTNVYITGAQVPANETDPIFTAWLAVPPNVSVFTNDASYTTIAAVSALPVSTFSNDVPYLVAADIANLVPDTRTLTINGTTQDLSADRTWTVGDVTKVGTPVNNQIGVWTGDGTIEGDASLTFDTATDTLATVLITATTVTAALTGNVTGNVSGSAATVTGAAQSAITSLGTLTTLTVDDITINGNTISSAGASSLAITPLAGQAILLDATISIDAGVVTGAASGNLVSGGALGTPSSGTLTNCTFPTLNQNTTGSAAILTTARTIGGVNFDGSANIVPQTIESANEATDTTCFLLFITASGTQSLQPKNNTALTFNSNTSSLGATLITATTSVTSASILASSNDSGALGASGTGFSDLFLAAGAVINANSGSATLTAGTNRWTVGGSGANGNSLILAAGGTSLAPLTMTSGTNLTVAAAGANEFDGNLFYLTADTTQGRTQDVNQMTFVTTADGSAIGAAIADAFGANTGFTTISGAVYEMNWYCWFLKSTAGTSTWTITNTQAYTAITAWREICAVGGIGAAGAVSGAGIANQTTAASALPASASLTDATQQYAHIRAICTIGTAGTIRLRHTSGAGTITMRRGSYFTIRRIFPGTVGAFVA